MSGVKWSNSQHEGSGAYLSRQDEKRRSRREWAEQSGANENEYYGNKILESKEKKRKEQVV